MDKHESCLPGVESGENGELTLCVFFFSGASDRFLGNHTHTDFFKLLRQDGDSLVIGARNVIYNITIDGLAENRAQVSGGASQSYI